METLSLSEAKMKLSELVARVASLDAEVTITKNGRPAAVMISPDEFERWRETLAVKSDADLMKEIKKGLSGLEKESAIYTLAELFEDNPPQKKPKHP